MFGLIIAGLMYVFMAIVGDSSDQQAILACGNFLWIWHWVWMGVIVAIFAGIILLGIFGKQPALSAIAFILLPLVCLAGTLFLIATYLLCNAGSVDLPLAEWNMRYLITAGVLYGVGLLMQVGAKAAS
jgi:hypothetical protein